MLSLLLALLLLNPLRGATAFGEARVGISSPLGHVSATTGLSAPARGNLCVASWYGEPWRGRRTASGERFDPDKLTCAHKSLPFGTRLRVRHGEQTVTVEVTDRGPYVAGRELDLSRAAFERLAPLSRGLINVRYRRTQ